MQSMSRKTHNMVIECSYCRVPFELRHIQEVVFKKGGHVFCSAECRNRFHAKNPNFVGKSTTEKPLEKPIPLIEKAHDEKQEQKLKVRCLECGRIFQYEEASPEIKEIVWFCSEKCREKYASLHFQRDMKELQF